MRTIKPAEPQDLFGGKSHVAIQAAVLPYHAKDFVKAIDAYDKNPDGFIESWDFLNCHPANFEAFFDQNITLMVVKVDPKTLRIETKKNKNWKKNGKGRRPADKKRNTRTQVWIEWGPFNIEHNMPSHDHRCDTGGDTFEEAIVNLANNVYHLYGADPLVSFDKKLPKKLRK